MNYLKLLTDKITEHKLWEKDLVIDRNEFLKVSGSIETNLYYIVSGSLRIFTVSEYEEHTIRLGYQGNLVTALDSYITEQPSQLYIQAIKQTKVKSVSKKSFEGFINSTTENTNLWTKILGLLIVEQMEREQDILINSPSERYKRVLQRSPQLFHEIPNKYIASYLRMSPETLSRLKKS